MDGIGWDPGTQISPLKPVVGEWYLKGFADAYTAHWAVAPAGPLGEQYMRGYALGLAAVRQMYYFVLNRIELQQAAVPLEP